MSSITKYYNLDTDETLSANSDQHIASQKAIKSYIDNQATGANRDLSNLSTTGQMILDTQSGTISNVIVEVKQNIKMTLESNLLTLKAESILTDSGSTYNTITINEDKTVTIDVSGEDTQWIVFAQTDGTLIPVLKANCVSGATDDLAGTAKHIWFKPDTKEISYYVDGTTATHVTYPLCSIDVIGDVAYFTKSARDNDIIFNGIGFVGHHAYVLPGIRTLIANGIDDNGKLRSINVLSPDTVTVLELPAYASNTRAMFMKSDQTIFHQITSPDVDNYDNLDPIEWNIQYVRTNNHWYQYRNGEFSESLSIKLADFTTDAYKHVQDFTFIYPVKLVKDDEFEDLRQQVETNTINIAQNTADILTKAEDNEVVHKAGNEVITGTKTFATGTSEDRLNFQMTDYALGELPANNHFAGYKTVDKNGVEFGNSNTSVKTDGTVGNNFYVVNKKEDGTTVNAALGVYVEKDGTSYATAPTITSNTDNSDKIVTTAYLNGSNNNVVHKTGDETVAGSKTFSSVIKRSSTIDQSTTSGEVEVGSITVYDKDGSPVGLYNTTRSATINTNRQRVTNKNVTGANWFDIRVNINDAGKGWVNTAQGGGITSNGSLSDASSSTADVTIPTKGWVNNPATSTNVVHRSGDETLAGTKTFSTTPVVGTLAEDNNSTSAASTAYVTRAITTEDGKVVHNTGAENVAGIKTFTDGITIPANSTLTATAGTVTVATQTKTDSSTKAASTAFVKNNLADYVPTTRKINDKALSSDITLTYSDVNALSSTTTINDLTTTAQQNALNSGITSSLVSQITTNKNDITTINGKIPSAASSTNQLADKDFVNSSISTNTATFDGSWDTYALIPTTAQGFIDAGFEAPTNNNYLVVKEDETQDGGTWRYKYASDSSTYNKNNWKVEYEVNETPMTSAQLNALNSGITSSDVTQITTNKNAIGTLSSLSTTEKTNLVGAINELDTDKVEANASITGATKCKITYDSKGLVTAGANLSASDIPSLTLSKISDVTASAAELNVLDGITASTTELNYTDGVTSNIQTQIDNVAGKVLDFYGTCDTAAATQTKDVVCAGFSLKTGASVRVKFTNGQDYNGAIKLNVNNTGAIDAKYVGTSGAARYTYCAGELVSFTYDGTNWLIEDGGLASTTYYGVTKLATSAISTNQGTALTPAALNNYAQSTIANYPVYSASSTYAIGDRVRYGWQTFECNTAITTAEAWTAAHWTALPSIQEQIDTKADSLTAVTHTANTAAGSTSQGVYVDANGQVQLCDAVTSTYSATGTAPINGIAVKSAIDAAISSTYKPAGSIAFASRPTPAKSIEGNVYNITDAFTTDSTFVEGAGKSYPAGTNIVCINTSGTTYKYDVLAGFVDLSGYVPTTRKVNNKALSSDISLTASDVGAVASNTAITGATKCKITYDSKGLVTAGTDLAASDIPSLTLSKISDVTATATELNVLDGITATTTELNYTDGVTSNIQTQLNAKAADSNVVHKTGDETISGAKTFTSPVTIGSSTLTYNSTTQALEFSFA